MKSSPAAFRKVYPIDMFYKYGRAGGGNVLASELGCRLVAIQFHSDMTGEWLYFSVFVSSLVANRLGAFCIDFCVQNY